MEDDVQEAASHILGSSSLPMVTIPTKEAQAVSGNIGKMETRESLVSILQAAEAASSQLDIVSSLGPEG